MITIDFVGTCVHIFTPDVGEMCNNRVTTFFGITQNSNMQNIFNFWER